MHPKLTKLLGDKHFMELMKGGGISMAVKVFAMAIGFVFQWLITSYYGVESLGLLMSSISVLSITLLFGKLGLDTAFLRFVSQFRAQKEFSGIAIIKKKSLTVIAISSVVSTAILYFFSSDIANSIFHRPALAEPLRLISFAVIPMAFYQFYAEGLRGFKRIREYALTYNAGRFIFGSLAFVVAYFIFQTELHPSTLFVIGTVVTLAFSVWIWRSVFTSAIAKNKESKSENATDLKTIFNLAIPLLLASSTAFLMNWTDTLMLTYFSSSENVAIYSVALKFATIGKLVLMAINSIAAPKFAEFYGSGDIEGLSKVVRQSTKLVFWASIPILTVLIIWPKFFLGFYGPEYVVGALSLSILAAGHFISAISGSVGLILQMTGKQKVFQNITVIATILNISLNIILIPIYGIEGAAIAGFVSIVSHNLISVYYIYRTYGFLTLYIPMLTK
ncbi:MAG: O-antigen/teichoic acid export membrane protein [Granulosicoccus sp.]|jgi:O-antigen/teichoic acid export membrane protein